MDKVYYIVFCFGTNFRFQGRTKFVSNLVAFYKKTFICQYQHSLNKESVPVYLQRQKRFDALPHAVFSVSFEHITYTV
jgi:hypothetical protein